MKSTSHHCVILFAHGARDERWSQTLISLRELVAHKLPSAQVALAFLEFQSPSLPEVLEHAVRTGCTRIDLVPVFWASGGHVANDLPPLLARFRVANPLVEIQQLPVLSEIPGLLDFIAEFVSRTPDKP